MKKSNVCPKCNSKEIASVKGESDVSGLFSSIPVGFMKKRVFITKYICTDCGFLEEWINSEKALQGIAGKYSQ